MILLNLLKSLWILIDWYGKEEKENNVLFACNNMKEDIYKNNKANEETKISSSAKLIPLIKKQFFFLLNEISIINAVIIIFEAYI